MSDATRLRPIEADDLPQLLKFMYDAEAAGELQWFGYRVDRARTLEERWKLDGLIGAEQSYLAVAEGNDLAGWVTWLPVPRSSGAIEIGAALFPEFRGRGLGTDAQRRLVDYLFATSTVRRLQAGTEVANVAEQRALEKVGFTREGVLRGLNFRLGEWRDSVIYGLLRGDL
jgi:RimJ/RimL family protein N-acetyltransferase